MEEVATKELRDYLLKYLKEERRLSSRSINYYNTNKPKTNTNVKGKKKITKDIK